MASLRDRAEALLEEVGLEGTGKLSSDVKAVTDALGVEIGDGSETRAKKHRPAAANSPAPLGEGPRACRLPASPPLAP